MDNALAVSKVWLEDWALPRAVQYGPKLMNLQVWISCSFLHHTYDRKEESGNLYPKKVQSIGWRAINHWITRLY